MLPLVKKLSVIYNWYALGVLTVGYILGELGHYLIGVTSKQTAIELDYGDHACQLNNSDFTRHEIPIQCGEVMNETTCLDLNINGTTYCEWNYNGLGIDYQLLAGPSFIAVFTIAGVFMGFVADKYNRVKMLTACTLVFAVAIILQGSVKEYWHLIVLRMIMAAGESGCNPLAQGIMSDIFPEDKRALVMAIFNWGIYGGYGIAFPVGRYITKLNIADLGWRACYYGTGIIAVIIGIITGTTLKEPERQAIGEENDGKEHQEVRLWKVLTQPRMILLMIAASIRHCGGMTFAYNADLYYNTYFPDVDLGWWLFAVTIGIGSIGVVVGGIVSDKIVAKMGIKSRVLVLALSQLISTPPAFGSVYFEPVWAMITLGISYFFAEMWFGIVFAVVVEIVPVQVRSTTIGIFLFVMNNVGGNLPILVDPVAKTLGYRGSIMIFYAGFYGVSSVLFFLTMFFMEPKKDSKPKSAIPNHTLNTISRDLGHDNKTFADETGTGHLATLNGHHHHHHHHRNGKPIPTPDNIRPLESSRL